MSVMHKMVLVILLACAATSVAHADSSEAKAHYKKGLSHFGLGKYAEAATEYEAAFEIEPDAALLYNAAQAHRLAGHKQRALELYSSLQRLFPEQAANANVQRHIDNLKAAIEADRAKGIVDDYGKAPAQPKPATPATPAYGSTGNAASPVTTAVTTPATTPVTTPAAHPAGSDLSLSATRPAPAKKRTPKWVWGAVAGGVVAVGVALGVGLGIGLSGDSYPAPTAGRAHVP
jgi:tetratricopeptide (TPR) repeat protein